jgi:hypothetical protein
MSSSPITEIDRVRASMPALALSVDADGRLSVAPSDHAVAFRCRCLGFSFEGRFDRQSGGAALQIAAVLHPLPFSIELPNLRQQMLDLVRASEALPHTRMVKLPDGRIGASGRVAIEPPVTQGRLIGAATVLILELVPYLALAAELLAPLGHRAAVA